MNEKIGVERAKRRQEATQLPGKDTDNQLIFKELEIDVESNEEEQLLVFRVLEQLNTSVERENLFREMKIYQESNGISVYNIKQRTCEHFYCPELGIELEKLVSEGLISRETRWNGEGFEQYYKISEFGKEIIQESMTQRAASIKEEIEGVV